MDSIQFYDITVGQYQLLNNIDKDLTEIEQNIYAVAAIKNITYDEASKIKLSEFNDMVKDIGKINLNKLEQKKVNNKIFLNGEEYHVEHRPDRLTSGQLLDILNIRANHQGESIQVMDLLIAALSRQKGKKYSEDNLTLTERAKYCRDVKVTDVWNVFVFFLESLERLLKKFRGLFTKVDGELSQDGEGDFGQRWGLFSVIKAMADLHNISINEATKLGAIEFLNWWAYMVEKQDYEKNAR